MIFNFVCYNMHVHKKSFIFVFCCVVTKAWLIFLWLIGICASVANRHIVWPNMATMANMEEVLVLRSHALFFLLLRGVA